MLRAFLDIFFKWKTLGCGLRVKVVAFIPINFTQRLINITSEQQSHPPTQGALWKDSLQAIFIYCTFTVSTETMLCVQRNPGHVLPGSLWGSVLLLMMIVYIGSAVRWLQPELAVATCCLKRLDTWRLKAWALALASLLPALRSWTDLLLSPRYCIPLFIMVMVIPTSQNCEN